MKKISFNDEIVWNYCYEVVNTSYCIILCTFYFLKLQLKKLQILSASSEIGVNNLKHYNNSDW